MNNSTRNLKMKKLLIATTALVATAGIASADITITGHAAAGFYSGLSNKDGTAAVKAKAGVLGLVTTAQMANHESITVGEDLTATAAAASTTDGTNADALLLELRLDRKAAVVTFEGITAPTADEQAAHAAELKSFDAMIALAAGTAAVASAAASVGTYSADGIYSNAGVDFTMTGATDNGISFSATVNVDAGNEIDAGDFELDGADGGTAGLGAVSMTGALVH